MLSKSKIQRLAKVHDTTCVSIYLPTNIKGQPVLHQEDRLELRSMIDSVRSELSGKIYSGQETDAFLSPLIKLNEDGDFWRNQQLGLALFLSNNGLEYFKLPDKVDKNYYVSTHYRIWPLIPFIDSSEEYFVVALNLEEVHLYKGSRYEINEVLQDELAKIKPEEVVGSDHEQKNLQLHSQQSGFNQSVYHGRGEGRDDLKEEISRFYHKIDEVITGALRENTSPVLLYGLDHLVGIYKTTTRLSHLLMKHVAGNPPVADLNRLHKNSWATIHPYFRKNRQEIMDKIAETIGKGKASTEIDNILPNTFEGRVDSLFIVDRTDMDGIYDPVKKEVRVSDEHNAYGVSLTNMVALETMARGGQVYIVEDEVLPFENISVCALYRY